MVEVTGINGLGNITITGASILTNGMTVFTVAGGFIRITDLLSESWEGSISNGD